MPFSSATTTGQLQPDDTVPASCVSHAPEAVGTASTAAPLCPSEATAQPLNSLGHSQALPFQQHASATHNAGNQAKGQSPPPAERSSEKCSDKNNDGLQQQPSSQDTPTHLQSTHLHLDIGNLKSFSDEIESYLSSSSSPSCPSSASSTNQLPSISSFLEQKEGEPCHTQTARDTVNTNTVLPAASTLQCTPGTSTSTSTGTGTRAEASAHFPSVTTIGSSLPKAVDSVAQSIKTAPADTASATPALCCSNSATSSKDQPSPSVPSSAQDNSPLQDPEHHAMAPSITQTHTLTTEYFVTTSNAELSDHDHASPRLSSSSSATSLSLSSSSSTSRRGYQLRDDSAPDSKAASMAPLHIPTNDDFLKPTPQKSEDWAALVDTPASPIQAHHHHMMAGQPQQLRGLMNLGGGGYTDSPAPEDVTGTGLSGDYMQHASQQQHLQQPYLDPAGSLHNNPYQNHHYHNSTTSVPLQHTEHNGSFNDNRQSFRKSWAATETLNGAGPSPYGYMTPPRHPGDVNGRSSPRPPKQSSVATSVSLLTDAAVLAKYRETAIKTKDASIQLSYAKYLLEIGDPCPPGTTLTPEGTPRSSSAASPNADSPPVSGPPSPTSMQQDSQNGKKQLTLEAIYWIDRLAKEGQPEAQFIKGTWYEEGSYLCKKNPDKAVRYYQSASKGDYGPAHYKYGYSCEKKKDNNKAVMLYKKAAIHNDVPASHRLAIIYLYGELGQSKNMKAGLQYLKRAASFATESAPMAPYVLGLVLSRDYDKKLAIPDDIAFPDDGEALEWFRKSAQLGYGPANYKLGYCYEYGSLGCPIDPFLSVQHYERAILAGDSNGEAEMALSGWYLSGAEGCFAANDQLAFDYATKAAEKKLPKAQYAMGYYHEVGIATPIDLDKAMEFYKLAAQNGNKDAQKRLEEQAATHDKMGHKNSIRRLKQGRNAKDQSCSIM